MLFVYHNDKHAPHATAGAAKPRELFPTHDVVVSEGLHLGLELGNPREALGRRRVEVLPDVRDDGVPDPEDGVRHEALPHQPRPEGDSLGTLSLNSATKEETTQVRRLVGLEAKELHSRVFDPGADDEGHVVRHLERRVRLRQGASLVRDEGVVVGRAGERRRGGALTAMVAPRRGGEDRRNQVQHVVHAAHCKPSSGCTQEMKAGVFS